MRTRPPRRRRRRRLGIREVDERLARAELDEDLVARGRRVHDEVRVVDVRRPAPRRENWRACGSAWTNALRGAAVADDDRRCGASPARIAASVVRPSIRSLANDERVHRGCVRLAERRDGELVRRRHVRADEPERGETRTASASRSGGVGSGTYAQSSPSAANAAFCIRGDSECSTGQPMMPTSASSADPSRECDRTSALPAYDHLRVRARSRRSTGVTAEPERHESPTRSSTRSRAQQPKPYSHFLRKNSDSLAVKKWCTPSGLRTK